MKIYILLFILIAKINAQTIEGITNSDTIYIELKNNHKSKPVNFSIHYDNNSDMYIYDMKSKSNYEVKFTTYLKNDFYKRNFKVNNLMKFKKSNKDKIITIAFINKYGLFEIFSKVINNKKKKIFIIDERNIKYRKIIKRATALDNRKILI